MEIHNFFLLLSSALYCIFSKNVILYENKIYWIYYSFEFFFFLYMIWNVSYILVAFFYHIINLESNLHYVLLKKKKNGVFVLKINWIFPAKTRHHEFPWNEFFFNVRSTARAKFSVHNPSITNIKKSWIFTHSFRQNLTKFH
jgi:hypothetical protein